MVHVLDNRLWFPDASEADEDGLLAMGGDLTEARLLLAYQRGIFPWYNEGEPPLWWCPDPRFVLFPDKLKVSKSMKPLFNKKVFEYRYNTSFSAVIENCGLADRKDQPGTWITDDIIAAYCAMHRKGHAVSAESWKDGELVGGLYGIRMGKVFFGESMFSKESNASKYAFISLVRQLIDEGVQLIDCQVYTEHLESLGAEMILRKKFIDLLRKYIPSSCS